MFRQRYHLVSFHVLDVITVTMLFWSAYAYCMDTHLSGQINVTFLIFRHVITSFFLNISPNISSTQQLAYHKYRHKLIYLCESRIDIKMKRYVLIFYYFVSYFHIIIQRAKNLSKLPVFRSTLTT